MELIDLKDKLERRKNSLSVTFTSAERTFLYGTYYNITKRQVNKSCQVCENNAFNLLLRYINSTFTIEDEYFAKHGKNVPNRYKNDKQWIKSKL